MVANFEHVYLKYLCGSIDFSPGRDDDGTTSSRHHSGSPWFSLSGGRRKRRFIAWQSQRAERLATIRREIGVAQAHREWRARVASRRQFRLRT